MDPRGRGPGREPADRASSALALHHGFEGLFDHRHQRPSPRCAPLAEVQRVLGLYRDRYVGFNVRHFHEIAQREHGLTLSYSFVKKALQSAGLVTKRRPRGRHRRRREPRPCFGELVHLDGSLHPWLALVPGVKHTLIAVVDDATKQLLYAELVDGGESTAAIMTVLRAVLERYGLPAALYTDRAHWAVHTPTSGTAPDRFRLTQLGRALQRLGIEHIVSYSPQARGRSERVNGTLQDRLVNELRVAGVRTVAAANRYLRERFIPGYNTRFGRPPADPASAFVPVGGHDLDQILCHQEERVVARDNTVTLDRLVLQIPKQRGRRSCAGLRGCWSAGTSTASTLCGGGPVALVATTPAAGVGRRDRPADGQQRTDHVSNASGQITCQRQND